MRIGLIGYGKMGKAIESASIERGWTIAAKIHPSATPTLLINGASNCHVDTYIDFSCPSAVLQNAMQVIALKKPLIIGTTGWERHFNQLKKIAEQHQAAIVYGQNFSLGVNIFFKISAFAAELIDQFDEYDLAIFEMHHRGKKDSPSGTALFLAEQLLKKSSQKKEIYCENKDHPIDKSKLHISSLRCGHCPGEHTVTLDGPSDSITLSHISKNRDAFAKGALFAAEWIQGKRGMYHFGEII